MTSFLPYAVDRAAARDPAWAAMRFGGETLTYGNLATRSGRLASVLRETGVGRGDRVGIFAGKGLAAGTAIYGIMKAGAAYVPLDPQAPLSRNRQILEDGDVRVLVAEPGREGELAQLAESDGIRAAIGVGAVGGLTTIPWGSIETAVEEAPVPIEGHDLAYVLYTSGSTGRPKGVAHTHASALAFAQVAASTYGFTPHDRLTNHAPLQFDLSTMDYFSAALAGATTVIVPEVHTRLPASLSKLLEDEAVTVLYMVPFALTQLSLNGALEQRDLSSVRWVLFGGEPFPPKHLRALMNRLPGATFSNVYGPTEVNGVTYWIVPPIPEGSDAPIPIGRPFEGVETLVVDRADGVPVEPGQIGELLIRSPTRMKGYWGRPDLDERVFDRRSTPGGAEKVFLRTGDLVREREDGSFDFLGRGDRQIKTRGYRVELDEVEAALLGHPDVEATGVYAVPDGHGSHSIEATVVTHGDETVTSRALLDYLAAALPTYAIPMRLDLAATLPRTTTGKVDRVELRDRALARREGVA